MSEINDDYFIFIILLLIYKYDYKYLLAVYSFINFNNYRRYLVSQINFLINLSTLQICYFADQNYTI